MPRISNKYSPDDGEIVLPIMMHPVGLLIMTIRAGWQKKYVIRSAAHITIGFRAQQNCAHRRKSYFCKFAQIASFVHADT
ncbi:hypothetical protein KCP69_12055 [Salmonella enterica subsp. enterica]|nr:hypothetical protein KCP69_12055 [Salmonella enterica subsp. enterica]